MNNWSLEALRTDTELSAGPENGLEDRNAEVFEYIKRLADAGFFGTLTLRFEAGRIVHLRKEENLRPSELSGNPRFSHGNR